MQYLEKKLNILDKTVFKNRLAKDIYKNFLFAKIKDFGRPHANAELKNILQINTAAGKGGAAKVACDFLNSELNKKGFNSRLLVSSNHLKNKDEKVFEIEQAIPKIYPELHKVLHKASRNLGWLDFFNPASFQIINSPLFAQADIVHLHNLHGAYFSPFALPELTSRKPVIWTLHDEQAFTGHCSFAFDCLKWLGSCGECPRLDYYPKLKKDTTEFLIKTKEKIYANSHFTLICPSEWLKKRVEKSILRDKDIRIIYNGINTEVFSPMSKQEARNRLNLPVDKKILMFSASGSLKNLQKGGEYIKKTHSALKNNPEILFLNIGGNSESQKHNWIDVPYISDEAVMRLYYCAADLFIYPTLADTFGLVAAESMACGTPVISFDNTPLPEIIRHMETGYIAKYRDAEDFLCGIQILLEDEAKRHVFGERASADIVAKFSLERMIGNYIALYHEMLELL